MSFAVLNEDRLQLFWCGEKLSSVHVSLNRNFSFPHLFLSCGCFALNLPFLAISSLFFPHKLCCPIHASALNKSNLSCWERKYWKRLMYFMVISCDRGRGRELLRVSILEEEEVMVLLHLCSLPQTVTKNNGSDRGTKGWGRGCRDWRPFKSLGVGGNYQNCLKWSLPLINYSRESSDVGISQGVK